jgi:hypothetical protein
MLSGLCRWFLFGKGGDLLLELQDHGWHFQHFSLYLDPAAVAAFACWLEISNIKNIFKGVTLHLLARIIAWSPAPAEIRLI